MKRTLTVVLTAAAFLVPAGAASAAPSPERGHMDASCNNGKDGNGKGGYNDRGRLADLPGACADDEGHGIVITPPAGGDGHF